MKNISSLSPSDTTAARQALESELMQRHFRLVPQTSAPVSDATMQVRVTFSEGVEGFAWVAEIRPGNGSDNERQVAIVGVPKPTSQVSRAAQDSLTLERKLVWEQPDMFVDFATLPQSGGANSTLLILEPGRLMFYRSGFGKADPQWQLWQTVAVAHSSTRTRDVVGRIDIASQQISLPGVECGGDLQQPQSVKCAPANRQVDRRADEIPGHEEAETAALALKMR